MMKSIFEADWGSKDIKDLVNRLPIYDIAGDQIIITDKNPMLRHKNKLIKMAYFAVIECTFGDAFVCRCSICQGKDLACHEIITKVRTGLYFGNYACEECRWGIESLERSVKKTGKYRWLVADNAIVVGRVGIMVIEKMSLATDWKSIGIMRQLPGQKERDQPCVTCQRTHHSMYLICDQCVRLSGAIAKVNVCRWFLLAITVKDAGLVDAGSVVMGMFSMI